MGAIAGVRPKITASPQIQIGSWQRQSCKITIADGLELERGLFELCLSNLKNRKQAELARMYFIENLTWDEIADKTSCPLAEVQREIRKLRILFMRTVLNVLR